jgi:hypothetical protein
LNIGDTFVGRRRLLGMLKPLAMNPEIRWRRS